MAANVRFDPEVALRAHYAAELEEERRLCPPAPHAGEWLPSPPVAAVPRRRRSRFLLEAATAALLVLSAGLSVLSRGGPLGTALADATIKGGRAAVVGAAIGGRFTSAVEGFCELKGAKAGGATAGRYR